MPTERASKSDNFDLFLDENLDTIEAPPSLRTASRKEAVTTFLALAAIKGLGRASLTELTKRFRHLHEVWDARPDELSAILRTAKNRQAVVVTKKITSDPTKLLVEAEDRLAHFSKLGITVLLRDDPEYPARLRDIGGPLWLFVHGSTELLQRRSTVAVVGTREPSQRGLVLAQRTTRHLANQGYVIVSGLAEGIDAEAHTTALDVGGDTVAVLGHGLGVDFPASNRELRQRIIHSGGAIVTEYLWSDSYSRSSFVERNRIQAGIAGAVVPIECRRKSGTAHTVRFANEFKRLLFGIRFSTDPQPTSPTAVGDNVYDLLADLNAPVFDLESQSDRMALDEFLRPISTDRHPVADSSVDVWRAAYRHVLQQLRTVLRRRTPDATETDWLLEVVQRLADDSHRET